MIVKFVTLFLHVKFTLNCILIFLWKSIQGKVVLTLILQSVTKIHIYLFLKYVFFAYISGTNWAIKKLTFICILVWRAFRWKNSFWNPVTKSADIFKNTVFPEKKKAIGKNPSFWKNQKLFFMDLRFRNWTNIKTSFWRKNCHATSSSQARCVSRIFVNQISISCCNNNEQTR